MGHDNESATHVFISYARADSGAADRLQHSLEAAGVGVWRDTADLWPGQDWRQQIREAITSDALVFIACFSAASLARERSFQNEELTLAIEELRRRPLAVPWIIPVRFDRCAIPDLEIGGGRTLRSIQRADLFGDDAARNLERLVTAVGELAPEQAPDRQPAPAWPARETGAPTFGIVTALPEEFVAMQSFVGNWRLANVDGDRADYVLGTVPSSDPGSPHQVVLTMLGETGNDAAAGACANLLRSYQTVRCVLMVGIAAGVPNPGRPDRHVRLGDIVIARWGIAEYDSVMDADDGPVPRRAFPPPSPLLERRVKLLEAGETRGVRPWEELLAAQARVLPEYKRPPETSDILYASDGSQDRIPHPAMTLTGHRPGQPKVHGGLIASGDRSLRSASKRDSIAAAHDVLAIEMEGKGIGNSGYYEGVEWFAIRGISDYGDRHVTPLWRKYASLAAAAYTRALLAQTPPIAGERMGLREAGRSRQAASPTEAGSGNASRRLDVHDVRSSHWLRQPVVDLMDRQEGTFLTLRVGQAEAVSITYAKKGLTADADPAHSASYVLPHGLLARVLEAVGMPVVSGEIRGAPGRTLAARLILANGRTVASSPADAIALALRAGVRLVAPVGLLDQASAGAPSQHDDQAWLNGVVKNDQAPAGVPASPVSPAPGTVPVTVAGIGTGLEADEPTALLTAVPDGWTTSVTISPVEAAVIDAVLRGEFVRYPSVHLLFRDLLDKAGTALLAATIAGRADGGVRAELMLSSGQQVQARAGDSIALALLTGAHVFASADLPEARPGPDRAETAAS